MSRLYKKPLYRPVPVGATIVESNDGTQYAIWLTGGREKSSPQPAPGDKVASCKVLTFQCVSVFVFRS
jgi:hypothetical protein